MVWKVRRGKIFYKDLHHKEEKNSYFNLPISLGFVLSFSTKSTCNFTHLFFLRKRAQIHSTKEELITEVRIHSKPTGANLAIKCAVKLALFFYTYENVKLAFHSSVYLLFIIYTKIIFLAHKNLLRVKYTHPHIPSEPFALLRYLGKMYKLKLFTTYIFISYH